MTAPERNLPPDSQAWGRYVEERIADLNKRIGVAASAAKAATARTAGAARNAAEATERALQVEQSQTAIVQEVTDKDESAWAPVEPEAPQHNHHWYDVADGNVLKIRADYGAYERINYVLNPTFRLDTQGWTALGGELATTLEGKGHISAPTDGAAAIVETQGRAVVIDLPETPDDEDGEGGSPAEAVGVLWTASAELELVESSMYVTATLEVIDSNDEPVSTSGPVRLEYGVPTRITARPMEGIEGTMDSVRVALSLVNEEEPNFEVTVDDVILEAADYGDDEEQQFFDGSMPGVLWQGTPHLSTSWWDGEPRWIEAQDEKLKDEVYRTTDEIREDLDQAVVDLAEAQEWIDETGYELGDRLTDAESELEAARDRLADAEQELEQAFPSGTFDVEERFSTTLKSTQVQYAVNSSETTAPTTGWTADTPTRTPGTFIWFRSVLTYADDSTVTSSPALLTGNTGAPGTPGEDGAKGDKGDKGDTGAPGDDGVSVTSVTPYFRQVATGASAPGLPSGASPSGWSTTEPAYNADMDLYRTEQVKYSNGQIVYTPVNKIASYEGIKDAREAAREAQDRLDALRVGSRNLLRNSDFSLDMDHWDATKPGTASIVNGNLYINISFSTSPPATRVVQDLPAALPVGTYTVTARVNLDNIGSSPAFVLGGQEVLSSGTVGDWVTVSETIETTEPATFFEMGARNHRLQGGVEFEWVKLERGSVPTDWTPAPEDVEAEVAAAHTAAGDASTAASNALSAATHNGRNLFSTNAPSGTAPYGTIWFQRDAQQRIIGQWQQVGGSAPAADGTGGAMGSDWQKRDITSEAISNLDVGKLTAGSATVTEAVFERIVADRAHLIEADIGKLKATTALADTAVINELWAKVVRSRKMTTDMLYVGGSNLLPDPNFQDSELSEGRRVRSDASYASGNRFTSSANFYFVPSTSLADVKQYAVPVQPGETYRIEIPVSMTSALSTTARVETWTATGTRTWHTATWADVTYEDDVLGFDFTIPANIAYMAPYIYRTVTFTVHPGATVRQKVSSNLIVKGGVAAEHLNVVYPDPTTGNMLSIQPDGLRLWGENDTGEPTISLTTSESQQFAVLDPQDNIVAGMASDGTVLGTVGTFDELRIGGTDLMEVLEDLPRGVIYNRNFSRTRTMSSMGGHSYITFDCDSARSYRITARLRYRNRNSTGISLRFTDRTANRGSTPAVPGIGTPTNIVHDISYTSPDGYRSGSWMNIDYDFIYSPPGSGLRTASVLAAVGPIGDTTSDQVEVSSVWWTVEDVGPNTNVNSNKGGGYSTSGGGSGGTNPTPEPEPKRTYTRTFTSSSWRTFQNVGTSQESVASSSISGPLQGQTPYYTAAGRYATHFYFNSSAIRSAIGNGTVLSVRVRPRVVHSHSGSGGTVRMYRHGYDASSSSWGSTSYIGETHFARGERRWLGATSNPQGWATGANRGIGFYSGGSTSSSYYVQFATSIELEIKYEK